MISGSGVETGAGSPNNMTTVPAGGPNKATGPATSAGQAWEGSLPPEGHKSLTKTQKKDIGAAVGSFFAFIGAVAGAIKGCCACRKRQRRVIVAVPVIVPGNDDAGSASNPVDTSRVIDQVETVLEQVTTVLEHVDDIVEDV